LKTMKTVWKETEDPKQSKFFEISAETENESERRTKEIRPLVKNIILTRQL